MDPVGIYTHLGNAALQHGLLSGFDSTLWMQASVSHSCALWGCQQSLGWLAGCQLSSLLLEEYYSSKAGEGCDIFEGGHCMRSAWYALAPIWCVFHSRDFLLFLFLSVSVKAPNLAFFSLHNSLSFFFFFLLSLLNSESPIANHWVTIFADVWSDQELEQCSRWQSFLPIGSDLGHSSTKPRVPGTGGVALYQAWKRVLSPGVVKVPGDFLARTIFYTSKI